MKRKKLSDMSLEELWELFPIILTEPDKRWHDYFSEMRKGIDNLLRELEIRRIEHIGSTAVAGIWAKPIIDILVEMENGADIDEAAKLIEEYGFIRMSSEPKRISLNYGYTDEGFAEKVFHLHLRCCGDNDELYFRDYLNEHTEVAKEYERLKLSLWKQYEHNRDAYTEAKTEFVKRWTSVAKEQYQGRYI